MCLCLSYYYTAIIGLSESTSSGLLEYKLENVLFTPETENF